MRNDLRTAVLLLALVGIGGNAQAQPEIFKAGVFRLTTGPCDAKAGSGDPEGVVTGNPCDTFKRSDATTGTPALYVKTNGKGNTGWAPVLAFGTQAANTVLAGPTAGGAALPDFRGLVKADQVATTVYTDQTNAFGAFDQTFLGTIKSPHYVSQITDWGVTHDGAADFRYLFVDELHAKAFIADLERALAGGEIVSKSVAIVAADFTLPVAGASTTFTVEDLADAPGMDVFEVNDFLRFRQFSRGAGSLTIADAWGTVTAAGHGHSGGAQTWTFVRSAGADGGTGSGTIKKGQLVLDYGISGNGYHEINALDGAWAANSPYSQIVIWQTHPKTGQTVATRLGNLKGITGSTEYGLYAAGPAGYAASDGQYLRATNLAFELHGIDLSLWDGPTNVFAVRRNAGSPYLSVGSPAPDAFGEVGAFLGWDHASSKVQVSFYTDANNFWEWTGDRVLWKSAFTTLDATGLGITIDSDYSDSASLRFTDATPESFMRVSARNTGVGWREMQIVNSSHDLNSRVELKAARDGYGSATLQVDLSTTTGMITMGAPVTFSYGIASSFWPHSTDTYDLGNANAWWRQSFISQINGVVFVRETATLFGGYSYIAHQAGNFVSYVLPATTQIDFGQAMTVGDFVLVKSVDAVSATVKTEYLEVGSLVSGTLYNVTRDLAGAHGTDPQWANGTPYAVLGHSGDGRIELNAYDTPRIGIFSQGATYNAQTELVRIGYLDGFLGIAAGKIGFAVGVAGQNVQFYDGALAVTGTVTASAGAIAGWTINAAYLGTSAGSGAGLAPADYPVYAGAAYASRASAPFRVDTAGAVTAESGTIGGWTLAAAYLATATGSGAGMAPADYPVFAGATYANRATAPFRVTNAGAVTASSGTIAGWALASTSFSTSSGSGAGMAPADYPFWSGQTYANRATAPFRVDTSGNLFASSVTVTGTIYATGGYLGNASTDLGVDAAGLNVGNTGRIIGGATDYDSGTGFFLGYHTAAYRFFIGNSAAQKFRWDGTNLYIKAGNIILDNTGTWLPVGAVYKDYTVTSAYSWTPTLGTGPVIGISGWESAAGQGILIKSYSADAGAFEHSVKLLAGTTTSHTASIDLSADHLGTNIALSAAGVSAGLSASGWSWGGGSAISSSSNVVQTSGNQTIAGNKTFSGQTGLNSGFSSYDADGLFSANALYSFVTTPGETYAIRLGYSDAGSGQYVGRIGFHATGTAYQTATHASIGLEPSTGDFTIRGGASNAEYFRMLQGGTSSTLQGVLNVQADSASSIPTQIQVRGVTDSNKQVLIGYNTTSNYGSVQAIFQGTAYEPLVLNYGGGAVIVGGSTATVRDSALFDTNGGIRSDWLIIRRSGANTALFDRTTNDGDVVSFAQDGTIEGTVSISGTTTSYNAFVGSHYFQLQPKQTAWAEGTVLVSTGTLIPTRAARKAAVEKRQGLAEDRFVFVSPSTRRNQRGVYGVLFGKLRDDAKEMSWGDPDQPVYQVAGLGLFYVWVTDTAGNIEIGDLLATSPVQGLAERQTTGDGVTYDGAVRDYTVGKALVAVDWATVKAAGGVKRKRIPVILYAG